MEGVADRQVWWTSRAGDREEPGSKASGDGDVIPHTRRRDSDRVSQWYEDAVRNSVTGPDAHSKGIVVRSHEKQRA